MALLARDGVWRTEAPLVLGTNSLELTGASRADLAVRCSADSALTVNGTTVANIYADSNLDPDLTVGPFDGGANIVQQRGQRFRQGEKYGMIKFGSTTELILPRPDDIDVRVAVGDKVTGGRTVLAVVRAE